MILSPGRNNNNFLQISQCGTERSVASNGDDESEFPMNYPPPRSLEFQSKLAELIDLKKKKLKCDYNMKQLVMKQREQRSQAKK